MDLRVDIGGGTIDVHYLRELKSRASCEHYRKTSEQIDRVKRGVDGVVTLLSVMQHRAARVASGRSNRTADMEIDAVSTMIDWAIDLGIVDENPIARRKKLPYTDRHKRRKRRSLLGGDLEQFFRAAERLDSLYAVPQTPLWRTIYEAGLRWREAAFLEKEDVGDRCVTITSERMKRGKQKVVPISAELAEILKDVLPFRSATGKPLRDDTSTALKIFNRVLRVAGLAKADGRQRTIDIHGLRKTRGTHLASAGIPIEVVQEFLGHADIKTTRAYYVDVPPARVREAIDRLNAPPKPQGESGPE